MLSRSELLYDIVVDCTSSVHTVFGSTELVGVGVYCKIIMNNIVCLLVVSKEKLSRLVSRIQFVLLLFWAVSLLHATHWNLHLCSVK